MICSVTELKNLIFQSGIGLNFDVGICEDISEAVVSLEKYNLKACKELIHCFKNIIVDKEIHFRYHNRTN